MHSSQGRYTDRRWENEKVLAHEPDASVKQTVGALKPGKIHRSAYGRMKRCWCLSLMRL